jgi:hypothetical protein
MMLELDCTSTDEGEWYKGGKTKQNEDNSDMGCD